LETNKKNNLDPISLVDEYISSEDWRVKENSNTSYSFHGLSHHISTKVNAMYWLNKVYNNKIRDAHINGDFHIHDLGYLTTYCNGWDLKDLLLKGHTGVPGKVSCAPAKHLDSAFTQIFSFLYTVRHESAGAQAISSLDTYLAPFIYYDGLNYEEVKQRIQQFLFNMNLPVDKGFQVPFTNITLDVVPSGELAEENVIIGGEIKDYKYKDFQKEMIMFNKAYAEVMIEGDSTGRIFTWPIPTYNITENFMWDDLEPVWEMTAKFGIPYFSNFVNSDMDPADVRSMCCRLRIDNRELKKRGGGLFGSNPLTGSIGVVTINMPRIGYLSKSKDDFKKRLGLLMDLAKESLLLKRNVIEEFTERGLYPYTKFYLRDIKKRFGKYWKNHFNTIGLVGMNEACLNFIGKDLSTKEGQTFTLEILDFFRDRLLEYQEETDQIFNLEASPAEGASYRLAKKDKQLYSDILSAINDSESSDSEPYYTNSTQLHVHATDDLFEAMDLQDEIQCKYTGGTVFHVYLGERINSFKSVKNLVKKIAHTYKMPYFSITPTFSICPNHGYLPGEVETCPKCNKECETYSRVVGYISPVKQWNNGKTVEWEQRNFFKNK
jgi:ribonucleoside-triphosphate reductase